MSMDMTKQVKQNHVNVAALSDFDPLAGGGQRRPSANNFMNNDNNSFDPFSSFGSNTTATQQSSVLQPQRTLNVSQAFGVPQQQQQRLRQQQMAGLGHQVFQMGFSNNTNNTTNNMMGGNTGGNSGGFGGDPFFDNDDAFSSGGQDTFGNDDGFGDFGDSSGNNNGGTVSSGGFDMDAMMAQADAEDEEKERKRLKKLEKQRKKEQAEREAQEKADRQFAMRVHEEENRKRQEEQQRQEQNQLPGSWNRDHRGTLQGQVFERVTTKILGHKWSPRSMLITSDQIVLKKIEAEKRGQQRSFPITEYTTVGAAYINPEQAHASIDVDGSGPKRVYQFKLIEKEPWGNEPKQLCKLGSTDLRVIKFLRTTIAERVAAKY
jgi:hypothetical protein